MTNVAVVFQSGKGHTKVLADAILRGVQAVTDVSGQAFEISGKDVHEGHFTNASLMETLDRSDGIVFGCATYMGSASAIFKTFLEAAFVPHWLEQRWKDKIAAGFTNSASQSGDKLCTLLQLTVFAMQMGMIWVGVSDLPGNNWSGGARSDLNRLGSWLGTMGQSNADEDTQHRRHRHSGTIWTPRRTYLSSIQSRNCVRDGTDHRAGLSKTKPGTKKSEALAFLLFEERLQFQKVYPVTSFGHPKTTGNNRETTPRTIGTLAKRF